ncbi:hypothetical protein D3C76_1338960 [compost metagenome]
MGIQLLAGDEVRFDQLLIARQIALGVGKRRFIFGELSLGLSKGDFELARVNFCQQITGFYLLAFLEVDCHQLPVDAAAHSHGIGGGDRSQPGEITRNRFADGGCGLNRGQRATAHTVASTACGAL